jgi:Spy/CpxP family protein refolding chaperone
MRTARILLVVTVALLIAVPAMAAQEKKKKKARPAKLSPTAQVFVRMDRLRTALEEMDLTAEQQEKRKQIREEHGAKMKEVLDKMGDILTEEQKDAAKASAGEAKEAGKKGRAFFVAVEASIKITDEQKEKLDKLAPEFAAYQQKLAKAVRGVLTPEQRKELQEKLRPKRKKKGKPAEKKEAK